MNIICENCGDTPVFARIRGEQDLPPACFEAVSKDPDFVMAEHVSVYCGCTTGNNHFVMLQLVTLPHGADPLHWDMSDEVEVDMLNDTELLAAVCDDSVSVEAFIDMMAKAVSRYKSLDQEG